MSEPTQKDIDEALDFSDSVYAACCHEVLAKAYRALKKSHAQEIEKLKGRLAKHRLSCTCDDDSDEPCPRHNLWMREQDLRVKAESALKELKEKARWSAALALDTEQQVKILDTRNAELKSEIDKISGALVTEIATRRRIESALAEKEKNK